MKENINKKKITRKHLLTLMLLLVMMFVFSYTTDTVSAVQSQIYVSPTGNDSWDGQSAVWVNGTTGPKKTVKNATGTVSTNGIINVANGTYNENTITINRNMSIIGESRENTIINGTNTGRIFSVTSGAYVIFANLTLTNGNSTSGGGAISVGTSFVTVKNCLIKNNRGSPNGGAISGVGVSSASSTSVTVIDSTFTNNSASNGGAITNALCTLSVTNSNFTSNSATNWGGAIWNNAGLATIQFCRFIGNTATVSGNAIYTDVAINAQYNWWGSNGGPAGLITGSGALSSTSSPWMVLTPVTNITLAPNSQCVILADLQHDSNGVYHDPANGHIPDGVSATFAAPTLGSVSPLTGTTINGMVMTTFTAGSVTGIANPTFTVDGATVPGNVTIANVIPTNIAVNAVSGYKGDVVNLLATLNDTQNNVLLSNGLIYFYVNGAYAGNASTDGSGLATLPYTLTQGAGVYQILAQFIGNSTHSASSGLNNLTINSILTSMTVTNPASVNYGDIISLTATLTDTTHSTLLSGKKVYFSANGIDLGVATTNGVGVATLPYTVTIGAGSYQIMAQFLGDDAYSPSNATGSNNMVVSYTPTSIIVPLKSGFYNNSVSLSATLTDTFHNSPITGRIVSFFVNGTFAGNATTSAGIATLSYTIPLTAGIYPVLAVFAGDSGYMASNGTNNLQVNYTTTSITTNAVSGYYGDVKNLVATLRDTVKFVNLAGKTVNFSVNGILVGSNVTNAAGVATWSYNITQGFGTYPILAQFAGDSIYNASNGNNTLTVNAITTNITVAPKSGYYHDVVNLTATLIDTVAGHNSAPISGRSVSFSVNGTVVGSAVTNASGIATFQYNITQGAGIYPIFALFAGDTIYLSKNATNNLTVNYTPTNILVAPLTGYSGDLVNLTANLTDTIHGMPVAGRTVSFSVNGSVVGSAVTNATGSAVLGYPISLSAGVYQILAQFAGDSIYTGSTGNNNLLVTQIPTMLIVSPIATYYGGLVNLTANLTDLHNNLPLSGKNVSFMVNGMVVGSGVTNSSGVVALNNLIFNRLYPIMAQFAGDNIYAGSTGTTILNLNLIPTQTTVAVTAFNANLVNLTANLIDTAHSIPVSGKNITFTINGGNVGSAFTNASGAAVLNGITLISGINQIVAQFAGDSLYAGSTGTNILTLNLISTQILVNGASGVYGNLVNLTANLTDTAHGIPINGANVSFSVNGSVVGSAFTNASGIAVLPYNITQSPGIYLIMGQFLGDTFYAPNSNLNILTVNSAPTVLAVNPISGFKGDLVNLTASLTDSNTLPIAGRSVSFSVNGVLVGSAVTNGSGVASLAYTIAPGAGVYPILAQFAGDSVYLSSNGTNNLTVNLIPTQLVVNPVSGFNGNSVNLTASLIDTVHVAPVAGRSVSFSVNGVLVGSAVTNGSGVASLAYTIAPGAGVYPILAQFAGDSVYLLSNGTNNLTVNATPLITVVSTVPVTNAVNVTINSPIVINFNNNIKSGAGYSGIYVQNVNTGVISTITKNISGNTLTINQTSPMVYNNTYRVYIPQNAVTSLDGTALFNVYTYQFQTVRDTTPPVVTSTVPVANAVKVSLTSPITITFSKNIFASVNYSQIYCKNLNTGKLVTMTKSISGNVLTIKQTTSRLHLNTYLVYIPAGAVKDAVGNNLAAVYSFKFTTA